jgi:hypothetical protein
MLNFTLGMPVLNVSMMIDPHYLSSQIKFEHPYICYIKPKIQVLKLSNRYTPEFFKVYQATLI